MRTNISKIYKTTAVFITLLLISTFSFATEGKKTSKSNSKSASNKVNPLDFSARNMGKNVELNWMTNSEIGTKKYILERSIDGIKFYAFKIVEVSTFSDNSRSYYQFDKNPVEGVNSFYRVKVIHANGTSTYSEKIAVQPN